MRYLAVLLTIFAGIATPASGEGLVVTRIIGRASARPNQTLPPGTRFNTASGSKSELSLPRGAIVRTGGNVDLETLSHGIALKRGVTLVASAPGALRSTTELRAPGYKLKIRGTAQVAYDPGRSLKVVVLEGSVTVALDSLMGEFETLKPGQLLLINPSDHRLPEPVEINLQRLVATSALVSGEFGPLATLGRIEAMGAGQTKAFATGTLTATPLLLRGLDNSLLVQRRQQAASAELALETNARRAARAEQELFEAVNDLDDPRVVTTQRTFQFTDPEFSSTLGTIDLSRDVLNPGRTQVLNVDLAPHVTVVDDTGEFLITETDGPPRIRGEVTVSPDFFSGRGKTLLFTALREAEPRFARLQIEPTAKVTTPDKVNLRFLASYGMDVHGGKLFAGSTHNELLQLTATNRGINITNDAELEGGAVALRGGAGVAQIRVDHSNVKARQRIDVGMVGTPVGINIRNSSELAAVAANVTLLSKRAPITVDNAKLTAGRDILVDAYVGPLLDKERKAIVTPGVLNLRNAQLEAQAIRLRGYANGSDALVIDGSTLTAHRLLKLYGEGASTLRFKNQVTLTTPLAILAARTVEVDSGGAVNITGKGRVHTDAGGDHYNQAGYGTIQAGGGLTKGDFKKRENFKR